MKYKTVLASMVVLAVASGAGATTLITFDELNPALRPTYGAASPGFTSGGATFLGGSFSGWTYSKDNNTTTAGFTNQYAAFTGTDFSGTGNYAIASGTSVINLPGGEKPVSARVTNATYAALSMRDGDAFAKKFGGASGNDPDFFEVTFTGYAGAGATGAVTGTKVFRLADFTFANNALDKIVNTWELVDLTGLGNAASIDLTWASTDVGDFGINTPTYLALDNLQTVPEPGAVALIGVMGLLLGRRRTGR